MKNILKSLKDLQWKIKNIRIKNREKIEDHNRKKEPDNETISVSISASSVAKATLVVIVLLLLKDFVYEIRDILLIFFVSFLFAAALDPLVDKLQEKRVPRWASVLLIYLAIFLALGLMISHVIPLVASQIQELAGRISDFLPQITKDGSDYPFIREIHEYFKQFYDTVDIQNLTENLKAHLQIIASQLLSVAGNTWEAIKVISNGLINTIFILILTFFMVVEERTIEKFILSLFPARHGTYITDRITAIKKKIGHWLRGQLLLSLSIGIITFVGLVLIGMDFAVTLALIAAITELIPYVGPIIALLIALPIAANDSFWMVIAVSILYFVIQQLENNFLVPVIMEKSVGLSPIIVMFAMLVGAQYLGILGLILAIPVSTCIAIFVRDYTLREKA